MTEGLDKFEDIECSDQVFDVCFHPVLPVVVSGLISGIVEIHKYDENKLLLSLNHHSSSCRSVCFSDDGSILYTASSDKSVCAINQQGQLISSYKSAHMNSINKLLKIDANTITTGDDGGCVKIWDTRVVNCVSEYNEHQDYISCLKFAEETQVLLSTSGDASLCTYDIRKGTVFGKSSDQESELHCVETIKDEKKVVCGTQDGVLLIFSWGRWEDCSDRFPGHPNTVDCMLKLDENTIITGSEDGLIRVIGIHPNKMLGIIGDHDNFPVEGMKKSYNENVLCSFSHDEVIRFWDISMFNDDNSNDAVDDSEEVENEVKVDDANMAGSDDDWMEEMEEDTTAHPGPSEGDGDGDGGSDSDDDDSESGQPNKASARNNRFRLPSANENFFADL